MSVRTFCLECERKLDLGNNPQVGQRIKCEYCEVQLEIINIDPLELDWIYERHDTRWDAPFLEENSIS